MRPQHGLFPACPVHILLKRHSGLCTLKVTQEQVGALGMEKKTCCEFKKNMDLGSRRGCCGLDGSRSFPVLARIPKATVWSWSL